MSAEQMVAACRQAGVSLFVHENWRWQPPLRQFQRVLAEGAIGAPFRARIEMISGFPVFDNSPSRALLHARPAHRPPHGKVDPHLRRSQLRRPLVRLICPWCQYSVRERTGARNDPRRAGLRQGYWRPRVREATPPGDQDRSEYEAPVIVVAALERAYPGAYRIGSIIERREKPIRML